MSDALDYVRIDGDDLHVVGSVVASVEGDPTNIQPDYPNGTTRVTLTDGTIFAAKFGHVFIWENVESFPDEDSDDDPEPPHDTPAIEVVSGNQVWNGAEWLRVIHTASYYGGNDVWRVTLWYPNTNVTLDGHELLCVRRHETDESDDA